MDHPSTAGILEYVAIYLDPPPSRRNIGYKPETFSLLRKDIWTAHVLHIYIAEAYVRKKDRFDCTIPCTRAYQQWKENTIFTWN